MFQDKGELQLKINDPLCSKTYILKEQDILNAVQNGTLFGFLQVDITTPDHLRGMESLPSVVRHTLKIF